MMQHRHKMRTRCRHKHRTQLSTKTQLKCKVTHFAYHTKAKGKIDWFQSTSTSCKFIENWVHAFVCLSAHLLWAAPMLLLMLPPTSFVSIALCWYRPHAPTNILCPLVACIIKCTCQLTSCITAVTDLARVKVAPNTWSLVSSVPSVHLYVSPSWWVFVWCLPCLPTFRLATIVLSVWSAWESQPMMCTTRLIHLLVVQC